jgi:hypothetical protein
LHQCPEGRGKPPPPIIEEGEGGATTPLPPIIEDFIFSDRKLKKILKAGGVTFPGMSKIFWKNFEKFL